MNPIERFSSRVENYAKYRPGYPEAILDKLSSRCGLTKDSIIADIGSGTGILSELFLKNGNQVFGIEPNEPMRLAAEALLRNYPNFKSVGGRAESTKLETSSIDFVTAGQAFHWFDQKEAKREFLRILKPGGWIVLIWNERKLDSTPFLSAYEGFLLKFGTDYQHVRHENITYTIAEFFAPSGFQKEEFENIQHLDFEGLQGRVRSASYTPEPSDRDFEPMMAELRSIFNAHQDANKIALEYSTKVYYGCVKC